MVPSVSMWMVPTMVVFFITTASTAAAAVAAATAAAATLTPFPNHGYTLLV